MRNNCQLVGLAKTPLHEEYRSGVQGILTPIVRREPLAQKDMNSEAEGKRDGNFTVSDPFSCLCGYCYINNGET